MTKREFDIFLKKNKKEVDESMARFEEHSKEFDKKMRKILLTL
jgi:hypothetical protein